jgi:hypothetical protein
MEFRSQVDVAIRPGIAASDRYEQGSARMPADRKAGSCARRVAMTSAAVIGVAVSVAPSPTPISCLDGRGSLLVAVRCCPLRFPGISEPGNFRSAILTARCSRGRRRPSRKWS